MTVIAIDGPSGSGKSTVARLIAERLEMPYLDTGAMYRVVGLMAIQRKVAYSDGATLTAIAAETKMQLLDERTNGKIVPTVVVNGGDVSADIRTPEVSQAASAVAVHATVRDRLVRRQRNWVTERGGGVLEGRDIGSVVFPDALMKVYLTASDEERVRRRLGDADAPAFKELSQEQAHAHISERDNRDSTREASPLAATADALIVDTSGRDPDDVATEILGELRKRCGGELPTVRPPQ